MCGFELVWNIVEGCWRSELPSTLSHITSCLSQSETEMERGRGGNPTLSYDQFLISGLQMYGPLHGSHSCADVPKLRHCRPPVPGESIHPCWCTEMFRLWMQFFTCMPPLSCHHWPWEVHVLDSSTGQAPLVSHPTATCEKTRFPHRRPQSP